jgi:ATP-dependent exoDNAse (exonuclease V) beta subunit
VKKQFTHIPHTFASIESVEDEINGRRYLCEGVHYPSVTTVTGWEKRIFFAQWRKNNQAESKRVIKRGTNLHSIIERYLLNQDLKSKEIMPDVLDLFLQTKPILDQIDNIHAIEAPLFSRNLKLAGRIDCIAEFNGKLSVIDFKGSTRLKTEEHIENYFTQTTAYAIMWQELFGIPITNICIIITCETGEVQVFERNPVNYVRKLKKAIDTFRKDHHE